MNNPYEKFIIDFEINEPTSETLILNLQNQIKIVLPKEYIEFMLFSNGGEGTIGQSYLALWRVEDIIELNEAYKVSEYAPGLLIIGSDGGDTAYCIDMNIDKLPIVQVPFIGMDLDEVCICGNTFIDFLESL